MIQSSSLRIRSRETRPGHFELTLEGRLDSAAADRLEEVVDTIVEGRARKILLDMAGVSFIASRGIGVVIGTYKRLRSAGGELAMSNLQAPVQKVFSITAALPQESIFTGEEEADSYFEAIQRQVREKDEG